MSLLLLTRSCKGTHCARIINAWPLTTMFGILRTTYVLTHFFIMTMMTLRFSCDKNSPGDIGKSQAVSHDNSQQQGQFLSCGVWACVTRVRTLTSAFSVISVTTVLFHSAFSCEIIRFGDRLKSPLRFNYKLF